MKFQQLLSTRVILLLVTVSFVCIGCKEKESKTTPASIQYAVKTQWKHDTQSFTQGLVIHEGKLFESTGQEKSSWIGIVDIKTGKLDKKITLEDQYFGEGITILNNKIYQLTWKSKTGFIYDLRTFKKIGEFQYDSEGWGITHDGKNLIMSDGSDKLTFLDTITLKPVRTISVTNDDGPVTNLNELEFVEGFVMANLWQTNIIVEIDPATGKIVGQLDLSPLAKDAQMRSSRVDVLNGIAYHTGTKLLLVTGKYWPMTYVIQLKGTAK
jgi:glutaminyl-peptide cyclotransferase